MDAVPITLSAEATGVWPATDRAVAAGGGAAGGRPRAPRRLVFRRHAVPLHLVKGSLRAKFTARRPAGRDEFGRDGDGWMPAGRERGERLRVEATSSLGGLPVHAPQEPFKA